VSRRIWLPGSNPAVARMSASCCAAITRLVCAMAAIPST
jgi:hypothetical protein